MASSIYSTIQGDVWDMIAFKIYGDTDLTYLLLDANPVHVKTTVFDAGVILNVPEAPEETTADLPPWR